MDDRGNESRQAFQAIDPALQSDRRVAQRIRQPIIAEISQWLGDRCGMTFGVEVLDISTTGVGIVHSDRLEQGAKYLLQVARPNRPPLSAMFTVVRCDQSDSVGGHFNVTLEPDDVLDVAVRAKQLQNINAHHGASHNIAAIVFAILLGAAGAAYLMLR